MAAAASQILVFPGWDCQDRDGLLMRCARALVLFPTCQVRVVRFYVSCPASGSSSSSSASAGPEQKAQDQSDPRQTSTASARSQCSLPDPNSKLRIRVFPAGPQPQRISEDIPDRSQMNECQKICQIHMPERMSDRMPNKVPEEMAERMSE